jgi:hypothetical protein
MQANTFLAWYTIVDVLVSPDDLDFSSSMALEMAIHATDYRYAFYNGPRYLALQAPTYFYL